jgi:predicted deacylase
VPQISDIFTLDVPFRGVYRLRRIRFGLGRPRLVILTGLHGRELNGIHATHLLANSLRLQQPMGTVDVFPVVNTFGIDDGHKRGPFEDEDLNRACPGRPEGTAIQRLAHALLCATRDADVCVDIHTGSPLVAEIAQVRASPAGRELELARAMRLPLVWRREPSPIEGAGFVGAWRNTGCPALRIMAGRGGVLEKDPADLVARGLRRLMAALGMVSGPTDGTVLADVSDAEMMVHRSGTGGFFVSEVGVGSRVAPGHLLGRIVAPVGGETLEEVRAECAGLVTTLRVYPMVHSEELLVRVALAEKA